MVYLEQHLTDAPDYSKVVRCHFMNDANLVGALHHHLQITRNTGALNHQHFGPLTQQGAFHSTNRAFICCPSPLPNNASSTSSSGSSFLH